MKGPPGTPFLVINAAIVRQNIGRLAAYCEANDLDLRPHTKTHKSQRVAAMQMEAGAVGLTCAKVGEAEVMSEAADDLLVAYPAVDKARTQRLAKLAMHKTVRVAVDSLAAIQALGDAARASATTIGVLVDLDVGFHRTGAQSPDAALKLAQIIDKAAGLRLDGLFCFPGQIFSPPDQQETELGEMGELLAETIDLWVEHGLEPAIVSGGSSPTAFQSHLVPDLTEIRPGTYVYNDSNMLRGGFCKLEDCAARIIATVVSDAVPGQIVVDAGSKTLTQDRAYPDPVAGFGYIVEYPQAKIVKLTEEHGQVDVTGCDRAPKIGEVVSIIPNHICPCVNLQDAFWWDEGEGANEPWAVDARGLLS